MIATLIVLNLVSQAPPLEETLSDFSKQQIRWNSERHQHDYSDPKYKSRVQELLLLLRKHPQEFLSQVDRLSPAQRKRLSEDDPNNREEPIDVLAAELKFLLQEYWQENIGASYPYIKSELWSLAKYRLKKIFRPQVELDSGLSVFRHQAPSKPRLILACARQKEPNRIKDLGSWKALNSYEFAGIDLELFQADAAESLSWSCGKLQKLSWKQHELPLESPKKELTVLPGQAEQKLQALVLIGLIQSLSSETLKWTKRYLVWKAGYELISEEKLKLEEALGNELLQAHWFINLIDLPHANRFQWSEGSADYQLLRFEKKIGKKPVQLNVLLPPTHSQFENKGPVAWTREQLASVIAERESPIAVLDLACFSNKTQQHWISAFEKAAVLQSRSSFELPLIISSRRGQKAERLREIVLAMDLVLETIEEIAEMAPRTRVVQRLREGSFLQKLWYFFRNPFSWMAEERPRSPNFFRPSSSFSSPEIDYLEAWESYHDVWVETANEEPAVYPPLIPTK